MSFGTKMTYSTANGPAIEGLDSRGMKLDKNGVLHNENGQPLRIKWKEGMVG